MGDFLNSIILVHKCLLAAVKKMNNLKVGINGQYKQHD